MAKMSIEELRELSNQIDDLYQAAKFDEGRKLLEQAMEHAKESDAAYHLFFQSEWAGYEEKERVKQRDLCAKAVELAPSDYFILRSMGVCLALVGNKAEAITWLDKALEENPMDWRAMRERGAALIGQGDGSEAIAWLDKALVENPRDSYAMRERGAALSMQGKEEEAITWFDKALAGNPKDWNAMRERGVSLSKQGKEEEAITWFDKALAGNPKDWNAMRGRGVSLSKQGKEDEAITWFDKALAENPKDWNAMRNRGVSLSKQGKEEEAITWYDKALAGNPKDWVSWRNAAVSYINLRKPDEAWGRIDKALSIAPDEPDVKSVYDYLVGYSPRKLKETEGGETAKQYTKIPEDPLTTLRGVIKNVRERTPDSAKMLDSIKNSEDAQDRFFTAESYLDPKRSIFLVLRKWNSFTPIIPSDSDERHVGGGYFLWHAGRGTVIDPGYNFIENFSLAGGRAVDIDNIVITHAHNDHTIDFESILTLVHQFNRRVVDGSGKKKQVSIYLNAGSMLKFSGLLNLRGSGYIKRLHVLDVGARYDLGYDYDEHVDENTVVKMRALPAYHDEIITKENYAVGLEFSLVCNGETKRIVITSDTGLFPQKEVEHLLSPQDGAKKGDVVTTEKKVSADTKKSQIWQKYGFCHGADARGEIGALNVLVTHLGSVKKTEFEAEYDGDLDSVFYPNHLGIMGVVSCIHALRPRLAVVSEFGEELRDYRESLMDVIAEAAECLAKAVTGDEENQDASKVLPGDVPFIYDIATEKVHCIKTDEMQPFDRMTYYLPDGSMSFYYFVEDTGKCKLPHRIQDKIKVFEKHLRDHEGLYFKKAEVDTVPEEEKVKQGSAGKSRPK